MYFLPIGELRPNLPIGKSGIIFCFDFCATEELLCDLRHTEHRGLKIVQDGNKLYQYVRVFFTRFLGLFLRFRKDSYVLFFLNTYLFDIFCHVPRKGSSE